MNIHRLLFPNCSQHELEKACARIVELEAANKSLKSELTREVNWNRKLADRMINFGLTKGGQFGIEPRHVELPTKLPAETQKAPADYDAVKEAQIDARVLELEKIYEARGHNVPRPDIRKMVEQNFVYLMDDDRVEIG
jgi:hypothetical protein